LRFAEDNIGDIITVEKIADQVLVTSYYLIDMSVIVPYGDGIPEEMHVGWMRNINEDTHFYLKFLLYSMSNHMAKKIE
jgi:hypothetical protein